IVTRTVTRLDPKLIRKSFINIGLALPTNKSKDYEIKIKGANPSYFTFNN
ncbi:hypothetical protein QBC39DRAFT_253488, partial [Podospora conica]